MSFTEEEIGDLIATYPEFDEHERVLPFEDKYTGLKGFIAIHNTNLGPATGGTRYWQYTSDEEALRDVLNLSKAMTYKCAMAGVTYGGGKGVIMANPTRKKTEALLKAYASEINKLHGNFSTGEDVGITEDDIKILLKYSPFINGRPGVGGDPAPWAAYGVFYTTQASLQFVFGNSEIEGRSFAIKGLGKLGGELCRLLYESGAKITVADIDINKVSFVRKTFPDVQVADPFQIHKAKVDVYSPCALGNEFTEQSVSELRCKIICGGANNQLAAPEIGELLFKKGIVYIPDYVANAGGLINVVAELDKNGYSRNHVIEKVKQIRVTTKAILEEAGRSNAAVSQITDEFAREIFLKKKSLPEILQERNQYAESRNDL